MNDHRNPLSRRRLLLAAAALPAGALIAGCRSTPAPAATTRGPLTTPEQTEGPFYRLFSQPNAALREPGMPGTPLQLQGRVLDRRGKPLRGALLDFWQCDANGVYDTRGFRLRGHQFADGDGGYRLSTIVPGLYPGRTRHIHVKVQPTGEDLPSTPTMLNLTTQLYFPGEPGNERDEIFDAALVLPIESDGDSRIARFDFVLDLG
jgi:protocatechuate 3,4-dioxygenase beta subunit